MKLIMIVAAGLGFAAFLRFRLRGDRGADPNAELKAFLASTLEEPGPDSRSQSGSPAVGQGAAATSTTASASPD